jgi:serine/threonine protein kinase
MMRTSSPRALQAFPEAAVLSDLRAEGIAGQSVKCRYCGRRFPSTAPLCSCSQDTLVLANPMLGRVLGGRFRFDEHLGGPIFHGVYRARHITGDGDVVVRLMPQGNARAAADAAHIKHAIYPRVVEVGRGERFDFVATELVEGPTLDEVIGFKRRLTPLLVARLGVQALHGLSAAHGVGVVHGRLHPRNLVLRSRGTLAVLDLGAGPPDLEGLTPGEELRALAYLPPEYRKSPVRTASVDVWGLSRILLELLLGRRLRLDHPGFDEALGRTPLMQTLQRGMARDPSQRFTNARSLLEELAPEVMALDLTAPSVNTLEPISDRLQVLRPRKKDWMVEFLQRRWVASRPG